jgi:hypothetical protein
MYSVSELKGCIGDHVQVATLIGHYSEDESISQLFVAPAYIRGSGHDGIFSKNNKSTTREFH